jgi:hypothetical protein
LSKTFLIVPDQHAHPEHDNTRADYLAKLTIDLRPDVVINLGDAADMDSLSSYDKGKRSAIGKNYKSDLYSHLEFQDRWWGPVKATKKKMPYRVVLEGNHEHRIERALDMSPEYEGAIGFKDYQFDEFYHTVVRYDGDLPGIFELEGILFAHYFPAGVSGRPIGGVSPARAMGQKNKTSCIQGHIHTFDFFSERNIGGNVLNCLVAGCFQDYVNGWAGSIGKFWRPGVAILRNVEAGNYDLQWVSLESLKDIYSDATVS